MNRRLQSWLPELAVLTAIGAVSIAATFPLIFHFTDRIPGGAGDNLYFFWELWWFKRALFDLHISPFINHEVYYPVGLELARDETTAANTVLGLPLTATFGPAVAYNLLILLSYVLSGYAVYRFVLEVTGNRWAGLVSGVAFAIAPYRMAHLAGHLNLMATQWLALSLLFLERTFRTRRFLDGALAGICFGLNALAAWYYLYIGAVAVVIYVAVRSIPWCASLRDRRLWYSAAGFVILSALLITPFALPYLQLQEGGALQRSFADLDFWSANLTDFLQPTPLHPLWGELVRQNLPFQWQNWVERTLSLGWILLPLAVLGAWSERRNRTAQAILVLAVASTLIALGPTLHWNGARVEYPLPSSIREFAVQVKLPEALEKWFDPSLAAVLRAGRGFVPLPAMLLYAVIPLTGSMRAILRFGIVTFWATAVLAGYGVAVLLGRLRGRIWAHNGVAFALGGLVLIDLWGGLPASGPQWTEIRARPVDEWLTAQPDQAVIAEFPAIENVAPAAMLHQTFNRQRLVLGGLPPSFRMPLLYERGAVLVAFPSADALVSLRGWNTHYVLVTPAHFASTGDWEKFQAGLSGLSGLELVREMDGVLVYEIK
jgi:hypothetical protein